MVAAAIWTTRGPGDVAPSGRSHAINASSPHLAVTRANGTLLAATVPYGSLVPGTAAAIALAGFFVCLKHSVNPPFDDKSHGFTGKATGQQAHRRYIRPPEGIFLASGS